MTNRNYWLLKSEPETYSIDTLKREKKTPWSGVRNYRARNYMRDEMRVGDLCLFYHSGKEKAVVGVGKVASKPYADPTAFETGGEYFDPKSDRRNPSWILVDIAFVQKFARPVSLAEIKRDRALAGMLLLKIPRLSIQPVSAKHFAHIEQLGEGK